MKILLTGSSGLVGSALRKAAVADGHEVICLGRSPSPGSQPSWNPEAGFVNLPDEAGLDAVVHLAGDNIAGGRWNRKKKRRILDSRVNGTRLLAEHFAKAKHRPRVIVSASAVGIYGDRGDEVLDESSRLGSGFLAGVCRQWEIAASPAVAAGIRVVNIRLGVVLSGEGGALKKMMLPFRMGLGGVVGNGKQYMSWVSLDDVIGGIQYVLSNDAVSGAVNLMSPDPVSNREFTITLGKVLRRPVVLPLPAAVARLAFGEMADGLLLSSARAVPGKLLEAGYVFRHPDLEEALGCEIKG